MCIMNCICCLVVKYSNWKYALVPISQNYNYYCTDSEDFQLLVQNYFKAYNQRGVSVRQ